MATPGQQPEPEPEPPGHPQAEPPPKQSVPSRLAEDGGQYSQGPVKPKHVDSKRNRSRPPRLLAADQRLVDAYEERYQESVTVYHLPYRLVTTRNAGLESITPPSPISHERRGGTGLKYRIFSLPAAGKTETPIGNV